MEVGTKTVETETAFPLPCTGAPQYVHTSRVEADGIAQYLPTARSPLGAGVVAAAREGRQSLKIDVLR